MATEHQFIYWRHTGGVYELDQESVENAPKEFGGPSPTPRYYRGAPG